MNDSTLSPDETAERLSATIFVQSDDALHASFKTADFASATKFVDRVALAADAADHHPDIHLSYGLVEFTLSSHDAGGVTTRDVELASTIQGIADELGARARSENTPQ